jgi:hypothetical protein
MAVSYNSKSVTSGLVGCWDVRNVKSNRGGRSLINLTGWNTSSVGLISALPTNFSVSGSLNQTVANENGLVSGTDPWGNTNIIWQSYPSGDSNADGGWEGAYNSTINNTQLYRSSVWMRRTTSSSGGNFYHGLHTNGTGDVYDLADGLSETNPYWQYGGLGSFTQNTWYLLVGHIYPWNYSGTTRHPDSGYYAAGSSTNLGSLGGNITDCKFPSNATVMYQRCYHYYCADTTTRLQFFQPRFDLIDGTQPSIAELIDNAGTTINDISGSSIKGTLINGSNWYDGYINFDGVNDYIDCGNPAALQLTTSITIDTWVNTSNTALNGISSDNSILFLYVSPGGLVGCVTSSNIVSNNTWYNIVATGDSSGGKIFLNGVLVASPADVYNPTAATSGNFTIGSATAYGEYFSGKIASVKVYNRALSVDEVRQNFNALRGRFGL